MSKRLPVTWVYMRFMILGGHGRASTMRQIFLRGSLGAAQGWYRMDRWPIKSNPGTAEMQSIFHRVQEL